MHIRWLFLGAGFTLMAASVRANGEPAPKILRGKIASIDTASISITKTDGTTVTASLAPEASFSTVEPRTFAQIMPTDFVGTTTLPGPGGTLQAQEIHILPTKGLNEGSYVWDHQPDDVKPAAASRITIGAVAVVRPETYTMTNASVAASSGMQLKVTFRGSKLVGGKCVGRASKADKKGCIGVAIIEVPPGTPIVAIVPGKPTDAKIGLAAFANVVTKPGRKLLLVLLVVEKNGVKPIF